MRPPLSSRACACGGTARSCTAGAPFHSRRRRTLQRTLQGIMLSLNVPSQAPGPLHPPVTRSMPAISRHDCTRVNPAAEIKARQCSA